MGSYNVSPFATRLTRMASTNLLILMVWFFGVGWLRHVAARPAIRPPRSGLIDEEVGNPHGVAAAAGILGAGHPDFQHMLNVGQLRIEQHSPG